jgi:hypothetical protein
VRCTPPSSPRWSGCLLSHPRSLAADSGPGRLAEAVALDNPGDTVVAPALGGVAPCPARLARAPQRRAHVARGWLQAGRRPGRRGRVGRPGLALALTTFGGVPAVLPWTVRKSTSRRPELPAGHGEPAAATGRSAPCASNWGTTMNADLSSGSGPLAGSTTPGSARRSSLCGPARPAPAAGRRAAHRAQIALALVPPPKAVPAVAVLAAWLFRSVVVGGMGLRRAAPYPQQFRAVLVPHRRPGRGADRLGGRSLRPAQERLRRLAPVDCSWCCRRRRRALPADPWRTRFRPPRGVLGRGRQLSPSPDGGGGYRALTGSLNLSVLDVPTAP